MGQPAPASPAAEVVFLDHRQLEDAVERAVVRAMEAMRDGSARALVRAQARQIAALKAMIRAGGLKEPPALEALATLGLTPQQTEVVALLLDGHPKFVRAPKIHQAVMPAGDLRQVKVVISQIRKRLGDLPGGRDSIETDGVGRGYRLGRTLIARLIPQPSET